jgi:hypothetical protein
MVAMRTLTTGEEVTYDYAMVMHPNAKSTSYFTMECRCGHTRCRKFITEDDWKIRELQRRYRGYFQWYLQEKIASLDKGQEER